MCRTVIALLFSLFCTLRAAAEHRIAPNDVTLTGPKATQRLLLLDMTDEKATGDRSAQAKWSSSNPEVAAVDGKGTVRSVADGEATITAELDGKQASAIVKVAKAKEPIDPSFRNHVIPMLTKIGCNSGACHGALAGKGGFKLSLRGYDPTADHFVMTRQALGRRIDKTDPAKRLVLRKPTMAVAHDGGLKLEVGSADFQLLADWIAASAPAPTADHVRIKQIEGVPKTALVKPN